MFDNRRLPALVREPVADTSVTYGEYITVLHVLGEIDIGTSPVIDLQVRLVSQSAPAKLVVDLTGVTFFGAAGLTLLLDAYRRTQLTGTALHLVATPRIVRLLRITELTNVFRIHRALHQALAAADDCPTGDLDQPVTAPTPRSAPDIRRGVLRLVRD